MNLSTVLFPFLGGALSGIASWYWTVHPKLGDDPSVFFGVAGTFASVGTTMLGFMMAALAVLASINHSHLVQMMHKTGHYTDLLVTLFVGCVLFMFSASFGFLMLLGVIDRPLSQILMPLLIGIHGAAVVSVIDIGRKFWLVLSNLRP